MKKYPKPSPFKKVNLLLAKEELNHIVKIIKDRALRLQCTTF